MLFSLRNEARIFNIVVATYVDHSSPSVWWGKWLMGFGFPFGGVFFWFALYLRDLNYLFFTGDASILSKTIVLVVWFHLSTSFSCF
ncbi:unnamed protein product [Amoebophrya sp. A120]|nr:unnamed protein product [Amoebophrya sp. A120]|eukprot:GSA120T00008453001.1